MHHLSQQSYLRLSKSYSIHLRWKCIVSLLTILLPLRGAEAQVFPPDEVVEGKTIAEWTADLTNWQLWVETAAVNAPSLDPLITPPDQLESIRNNGPVYFIPRIPATPDNLELSVDLVVPAERPLLATTISWTDLLFPLEVDANDFPAAWSGNPIDGLRPVNADWARGFAAEQVDMLQGVFHEFEGGQRYEGAKLEEHRVQTSFQVMVPPGHPLGHPEGDWESVMDGYMFMLRPLSPGERLSYKLGSHIPGLGSVRLTANIRAIPEPSSAALLLAAIVGLSLCFRRSWRMSSR